MRLFTYIFLKHDIPKNTDVAAPNGMPNFEIMGTSLTNVNTPNKVTSPVTKKIQKLRLTKPGSPKTSVKENSVKVTRQG